MHLSQYFTHRQIAGLVLAVSFVFLISTYTVRADSLNPHNGRIVVSNALVTAVSGSDITAETSRNGQTATYTILLFSGSHIARGHAMPSVGDHISFRGRIPVTPKDSHASALGEPAKTTETPMLTHPDQTTPTINISASNLSRFSIVHGDRHPRR